MSNLSRSLALLLLLAACEPSHEIVVRVTVPGLDSVETPVSGIEVLALPYDRDSVLAQFNALAESPRPPTEPLDSAFADFREPFAAFSMATYRASKLRDSASAMAARLDSVAAGPERDALRQRWTAAADSLRAVEQRRERAKATLDSARTLFLRRSDSLRRAIRLWEDSTYRGWDSVVSLLAAIRREDPIADTTDAMGWVRFKLPAGEWWIYARAWDAWDPNAEWYWNLPAVADTIPLSSMTGYHRPRY